jgi:hypothetical protein
MTQPGIARVDQVEIGTLPVPHLPVRIRGLPRMAATPTCPGKGGNTLGAGPASGPGAHREGIPDLSCSPGPGVPSLLVYLPDQLACAIADQRASRALRAWPSIGR